MNTETMAAVRNFLFDSCRDQRKNRERVLAQSSGFRLVQWGICLTRITGIVSSYYMHFIMWHAALEKQTQWDVTLCLILFIFAVVALSSPRGSLCIRSKRASHEPLCSRYDNSWWKMWSSTSPRTSTQGRKMSVWIKIKTERRRITCQIIHSSFSYIWPKNNIWKLAFLLTLEQLQWCWSMCVTKSNKS